MIVRIQAKSSPTFWLLESRKVAMSGLACSIGVHAALLGLAIWISPYLAPDPGAVRMIPLRVEIHFPPAAFLSAPGAAAATSKSPPPKPGPTPPTAPGLAPPKLVLPELRPNPTSQLTILLPNQIKPPTTKIEDIQVPSIMAWMPPRVKPKEFVMPGARESRPADLQTTAPLSLDAPQNLPPVANLTMQPGQTPDIAKLVVQVSASRPVRTFQPPPPRPTPPARPIETVVGDLTSLIALSTAPAQPVDRMRLPDGSQIARIHANRPPEAVSLAEPQTAVVGAKPDQTGSGGSAATIIRAEAPPVRAGVGGSPGSIPQIATRTQTPGSGSGLPGGIKIAGGTGASGAVAGLPGPALLQSTVPIRIEHPVNGVFDVVVVQSSPLNDFPGAPSLSGSPVYTVYVAVGRARMWILQFCVPKEEVVVKREGIVVQLGNVAPLKPPYPIATVVPPSAGRLEKIVVHGFISDTGEFESLKVLSGERSAAEYLILPLLQRWLMRPAARDGKPIRVEMMLLISG